MPKRGNKSGATAAKVAIFGLLWWAIYAQLKAASNDWANLLHQGLSLRAWVYIGAAWLLVAVNWSLEAAKWQTLLRHLVPQSIGTALYSVLRGVALALFTPNRIGEYGGRLWDLPADARWEGLLALLVSNMLQLSVNLLFGLIGFSLYCYWQQFGGTILPYMSAAAAILLLLMGCLFLSVRWRQRVVAVLRRVSQWLYPQDTISSHILAIHDRPDPTTDINLPLLWHRLTDKRYWQTQIKMAWDKLRQSLRHIIQTYTSAQLRRVWLLCAVRYGVYVAQYVLLLLALGAHASAAQIVMGVLAAYLCQTLLPTVAILELGIKGNIALYFLSAFVPQGSILAATLLLWCFNLALPALAGAIILSKE